MLLQPQRRRRSLLRLKLLGNHLRLDFCCTFEDVQDSCIAKQAADLVFDRETVAAVDLSDRAVSLT